MPRYFFLVSSRTFPWHSADPCVCKNSGPVFPIADPFQKPVSDMAGRDPGLRLAESFAQLGCEWGTAAPGACT